ncbi:MAG TPA: VOC family protein [Candidatus Acidoferrales bacterium]|nr:VOC family protein [Candidatus Acidoferrales bacterium]
MTKPIPEGYHSVTPYLTVRDAARALDFYQRVFGAKEILRMNNPQGQVGHAEIKIGDSMIMLAEETPHSGVCSPQSLNGSTVSLFVYLEDVDAVFSKAVSAGAKEVQPPADMFWGDRYGRLTDPFGHSWSLATHIEDVTPEEIGRRAQQAAKAAERARGAAQGGTR